MKQIFRLMIDDNDPRIMDEEEMMEDVYEKLEALEYKISELIHIVKNYNDPFSSDHHIKF